LTRRTRQSARFDAPSRRLLVSYSAGFTMLHLIPRRRLRVAFFIAQEASMQGAQIESQLDHIASVLRSSSSQHVADIVEALNEEPLDAAANILLRLPPERLVEVFDEPELERSGELIRRLSTQRAVSLLNAISSDRAAEIVRELEEPVRSQLLRRLDPQTKFTVEQLIGYPPNTAGSLMTTEFVSAPLDWTVGATLQHIKNVESTRETVYAIYILDPEKNTLARATSLRRLIAADPTALMASVAPTRRPIAVSPFADQEEVARLIAKYDLLAVPVVDASDHVLGIVTVDDIIDAMIEESTEDVQKFGGMAAIEKPYLEIGFVKMIWKRAGWLAALFFGEMLTASAMQHYETELAKAAVLTLFIPLIMSSGGNSGSQATSLIVRALALQEVRIADSLSVVMKEIPTGLVLGAMLGAIGIARIALWQGLGLYDYGEHWLLISMTVGAALVGVVTFGSLAGVMLPFLLKVLHFDPASASAPLVATLVDVTGIVIYFSVALLLLSGTLL
jgi:magnesium transporter